MADFDAIIIGSGHNGLVCAAILARAGWRVLVLEGQAEFGGGIRSGSLTVNGFLHDRYATNVSQFVTSAAYLQLKPEFDAFGLRVISSERPYASVHKNRALRIYTSEERTLAEFAAISPEEAAGWELLRSLFVRTAPHFFPLYSAEMPSLAMGVHVMKMLRAGVRDSYQIARLVGESSHNFASRFFHSREARGLLSSWAYHLDFAPHLKGGAVFGFVSAVSNQMNGMPIIEGGAGRITDALCHLVRKAGGEVRASTEVIRIKVVRGSAIAVHTHDGSEISAERAIIANVTTRNLFTKLISPNVINARFRSAAERFRYGPGTFVIHLALERMPRWLAADDLGRFSYIHLNGDEDELTATYQQCKNKLLPDRPLLVVSQTTPTDPSRAPPGKHVLRIHVRSVPSEILGDSAGKIRTQSWEEAKEPFAERILDLVEESAPDLRSCVIASAVETPEDIERNNPNFIGGDCVSGSHHLDQNFLRRPILGFSRYSTPIRRLYMIGASTWPGGGINAGSGYLLAKKLLKSHGL